MTEASTGGHLAIQYCPYCGEQNLFPRPEPRGAWECRDCTRSFTVGVVRGDSGIGGEGGQR